ncbi:MAG: hypothetical protein ACE5JG_12240 [Planctomycetota bacterium]
MRKAMYRATALGVLAGLLVGCASDSRVIHRTAMSSPPRNENFAAGPVALGTFEVQPTVSVTRQIDLPEARLSALLQERVVAELSNARHFSGVVVNPGQEAIDYRVAGRIESFEIGPMQEQLIKRRSSSGTSETRRWQELTCVVSLELIKQEEEGPVVFASASAKSAVTVRGLEQEEVQLAGEGGQKMTVYWVKTPTQMGNEYVPEAVRVAANAAVVKLLRAANRKVR